MRWVVWPQGSTTREAHDGQLEVHDRDGMVASPMELAPSSVRAATH